MKYLLRILFLTFIVSLGFGLYHKNFVNIATGDKIIGFSVVGATFIFLPLFLYHRWNGKKLKDYTLSEENLKKMRKNFEGHSEFKRNINKKR